MILGDTIFTHKDTVVQYKVPYKISLLLTIFMYYYYTNFELFTVHETVLSVLQIGVHSLQLHSFLISKIHLQPE